jgi:hypothetical protein
VISAAALAEAYNRNVLIVHRECEGLNHEESLLQPPSRGNCMNWVVGHMLTGRNDVLRALNSPFLVEEADLAHYKRESDPITADGDHVVPLERLLAWLTEGQAYITELMTPLTDEDGTREVVFGLTGRVMPLSKLAFFLYFHDSYHVGQTSFLRQLAGKDDKII